MKKLLIISLIFTSISCFNEPKKAEKPSIDEQEIINNNKINERKSAKSKTNASSNILNSTKNEKYPSKSLTKYNTYCNKRFSFCIDYPSDFISSEESNNGDGQTFHSKDGEVSINAWGELVVDGVSTLDINYERELTNNKISYKEKKNNSFVISSIENGKIFYRKTLKRKIDYFGNENINTLITIKISYPIEQKNIYDGYCKKINEVLE
jgi:hypothetical protein